MALDTTLIETELCIQDASLPFEEVEISWLFAVAF